MKLKLRSYSKFECSETYTIYCLAGNQAIPLYKLKNDPAHVETVEIEGMSLKLACNITEVEATGVDACSGAFNDNAGGAPYACFSGGSTWLGDASLGVCAFPCLMYNYGTGGPCTSEDMEKGDCVLSCDPREYWPNAAAFKSMNNTEA